MGNNEATVESLELTQVAIMKDGETARVDANFIVGVRINDHLSSFPKGKTIELPSNLQADCDKVFADVDEWLRETYFDLALE